MLRILMIGVFLIIISSSVNSELKPAKPTVANKWTKDEIDTVNRACNRICWVYCTLTSRSPFPCETGHCNCKESTANDEEAQDIIVLSENGVDYPIPISSCDFQFCRRSCYMRNQRAVDDVTCDKNNNCICS